MDRLSEAPPLDQQLEDLMETVWHCDQEWEVDDRIRAALRYRGNSR